MAHRPYRLEFDENGVILARDEKIREFIAKNAGTWTAESAVPGTLLLRQGDADGAGVLLSGEIRREGWLTEVISFVCNSRLTGKLAVVSRDVKRELFFDTGALMLASSTSRRDLLGEFILSEGVITKEQLDAALKELGPGRRLGQVLVEKGFLTRHEVYDLLNRKIEKIFLDALVLHEGFFTFDEDIELSKLPASIHIDTQALLMEGLGKQDELRFYRETVPRPGAALGHSPNVLENCSDTEKDFVVHVDGTRTLAQIDAILHLGDFETVRIARQLADRGLVEVILDRQGEQDALGKAIEDFNDAIRLIYQTVKGKVSPGELTDLGREFLRKSAQQIPAEIMPRDSGEFDLKQTREVLTSIEEEDRLSSIIMILSRYISYILFTANTYLPLKEQEQLSEKVYATLDEYS